jgi:branched-chain amino acid transport system permease protein
MSFETQQVPLSSAPELCKMGAAQMTQQFRSGALSPLDVTRAGRAIRATTQNRDAAQLLGIPVGRVYLQVLMFSGALAGICGCLVSSITQLSPTLGADPMLKAFIMCVVAGLGNLPGAVLAAFALAFIEAMVQYVFGGRWGFPVLLTLVILVLVWRPTGLFGRAQVRRL